MQITIMVKNILPILLFLINYIASAKEAICNMVPDHESGISGYIKFDQDTITEPVRIEVRVYGTTQIHGFHIHEKGSIEGGCMAAGAHFNPFYKHHGAPNATERHVGDLGNIFSHNYMVHYNFNDTTISLFNDNHIIGRACVVHEKRDDLGLGGNEESLKTGNAGGRIACGVVQEYNSSMGLFVGISVVAVAVIGAGYWLYRQNKMRDYEPVRRN
jgi:Cu-Zn family superoxide dismutase